MSRRTIITITVLTVVITISLMTSGCSQSSNLGQTPTTAPTDSEWIDQTTPTAKPKATIILMLDDSERQITPTPQPTEAISGPAVPSAEPSEPVSQFGTVTPEPSLTTEPTATVTPATTPKSTATPTKKPTVTPKPTATPTKRPTATPTPMPIANDKTAEMLELVNAERVDLTNEEAAAWDGLEPYLDGSLVKIKCNDGVVRTLTEITQLRAEESWEAYYVEKINPHQPSNYTMSAVGEDWGGDFWTSEEVLEEWMLSPGHRSIIMSAGTDWYRKTGYISCVNYVKDGIGCWMLMVYMVQAD